MEASDLIKVAAEQCVEGFTLCLSVPALEGNEWAENRLADMNLWISGTGACTQGRASLDSRLALMPEARDVIANLLRLLGTAVDEYRMQSQSQEPSQSHHDEVHSASSEHEGQGRPFSPWSDDSSSDDQSKDAYDARNPWGHPLREIMYSIESMQDQLARIAVAIRRSGRRSRLQKADQRFKATEHQELEGHLIGILLTQLECYPSGRDSSKLNEVQLRLIRCNLKRRNRFLYAQQHSRGLDTGSIRRGNHRAAPKKAGSAQEEMIGAKPNSKFANDGPKHATSTIITGTSASKLSDNFNLPQPDHAAPTASSIMSITVIDLDYPRPPRFKDDAHLFRCPCCCEALPVTMADRNRWRKHIADDLNPYTCILAGCDQPDILFNTKKAWRQHMLKDHSSMTYWICFACDDGPQFNNKKAFVQHTKSNHAATIPPDQISILVDMSKRTAPTEIRRCPLCNLSEEEGVEVDKEVLLNHIAKEIHSFSLRALPWADDNGQKSDERIRDSSEKVYEWLIKNEIQDNPSKERPPHETRVWHSEYFQQNAYFAGSSKASSPSEPDSCRSRQNDLEELIKMGDLFDHESRESRKTKFGEDTEQLELQAMETGETKVGEDHLNQLASMINLPSTYSKPSRWEEAVGPSAAPRRARSYLKSPKYLEYQIRPRRDTGKDGEAVWSDELEVAFRQALEENPPLSRRKWSEGGRSYGRNNLIAEYIYKLTGRRRTRKQISSHLQVLDSFLKGDPDWEVLVREQSTDRLSENVQTAGPRERTSMDHHATSIHHEAEQLEVQAMETLKTKLGADHPDTLTIMAKLASTYTNQGRWEEAEVLQVQAMETLKTKLGADHPDTLTIMAKLASTYTNQGRWEEAEVLQVQVRDKLRRLRSPRHADEYDQPGVDVYETGPMGGGRGAPGASYRDKQDKARLRSPRYASEYSQPRVDA